jgi:hypothetical protein
MIQCPDICWKKEKGGASGINGMSRGEKPSRGKLKTENMEKRARGKEYGGLGA